MSNEELKNYCKEEGLETGQLIHVFKARTKRESEAVKVVAELGFDPFSPESVEKFLGKRRFEETPGWVLHSEDFALALSASYGKHGKSYGEYLAGKLPPLLRSRRKAHRLAETCVTLGTALPVFILNQPKDNFLPFFIALNGVAYAVSAVAWQKSCQGYEKKARDFFAMMPGKPNVDSLGRIAYHETDWLALDKGPALALIAANALSGRLTNTATVATLYGLFSIASKGMTRLPISWENINYVSSGLSILSRYGVMAASLSNLLDSAAALVAIDTFRTVGFAASRSTSLAEAGRFLNDWRSKNWASRISVEYRGLKWKPGSYAFFNVTGNPEENPIGLRTEEFPQIMIAARKQLSPRELAVLPGVLCPSDRFPENLTLVRNCLL